MKVLVVGASGFVAGELMRLLRARGDVEIIAGVRRPPAAGFGPGIEVRRLEAGQPETIAAALDGATHAVNCVMGTPAAMNGATRGLLDAAARLGLQRVVHMSSIAVYGNASGDVGEDHPLGEGVDWYGASKVECEALVRAAADRVDVATLRPALIYGPGSALWSTRIARLLRAHRLGDLGEAGDGLCNLIHVRDVAAAIVSALTLPGAAGQAYNLADPAPPSWNAYLMAFARALGATPVTRIPAWQMKLERKVLAPPLKILEILAGKAKPLRLDPPPPITPGLARLFDQRVRYDSGKADPLFMGGRVDWHDGVAETAMGQRG